MFSLFAKPKRSAELVSLLAEAVERARSFQHDYVGVEHVMLGIPGLAEEHEARQIISRLPMAVPAFWESLQKEARVEIMRKVPDKPPFTPRLKIVLDLAGKQAKAEGQREITILHFLLGVVRENNSLVAFLLRSHLALANPNRSRYDNAAARLVAMLDYPPQKTFEQRQNDLRQHRQ